jgi:hypothetical protein
VSPAWRSGYFAACGALASLVLGISVFGLLLFVSVGTFDPFTPGVLIVELSGAFAVTALVACVVGGKRVRGDRWAGPAIVALVCLLLSFLCLAASPFVGSWWEERQRDKQWESVYEPEWTDTDVH